MQVEEEGVWCMLRKEVVVQVEEIGGLWKLRRKVACVCRARRWLCKSSKEVVAQVQQGSGFASPARTWLCKSSKEVVVQVKQGGGCASQGRRWF